MSKKMYFIRVLVTCIFWNAVTADSGIKYQPTWKSLDTRPLPEWYDDAKFGIFLHWGVYSVPSFGNEWFWSKWEEGSPGHVEFMKKNYPPEFTYQEFAKDLKAEFFDPEAWADLFKKSGAKYVVLTCKHNEGYTLWPSNYSMNWNVMDVGPHRDLVGDLATAIRNRTDLKFGLHYVLNERFNPMFLADKASNWQNSTYVDRKVIPELLDVVNKYQPETLRVNSLEENASSTYWKSTQFLAWLYNDSPVRNIVVVNDRWGNGIMCNHGGFYTCFEPGILQTHKGEIAIPMDKHSWGYRRNANSEDYHTTRTLLEIMVKIVSCGGNFLLNIAPTSDGTIMPIFQERLLEIGEWLSINGEAIYSSQPWKYQNELNRKVWYTAKSAFVYAIVLDWPNWNKLELKKATELFENDSAVVTLLGNNEALKWQKGVDSIRILLPEIATVKSRWAWVLKIESQTVKCD